METDKPFDALVIGSGIGGLSIGILLSLLRLRVAVIEKNTLPGGLMRSYRRGGLDCPVGIHYFGSFGEGESLRRMCDYLGITERMAVERMGQDGPIDRYLFDDFSFDLPAGLDAFAESLEEAFPGERQPIAAILKNLRTLADLQNSFAFLSASPAILDFDLLVPLGQYLAKMNCSARFRSVLGVASRWLGMSDADCPVLYHHLALVSYLMSSWRLRGSGSALAEAFVSRFEDLGGTLLCGDPVLSILGSADGVAGVKLASGRALDATRVVAAIHPKALLPMLPEGAVTPRYVRRIKGLDDTEGMFVANVAVDAKAHPTLPYNIYRLHADPDGALRDGVFYQLLSGRGDKNLLMVITKSLFSEWQTWESSTTGSRGAAYEDEKVRRAGRLVGEAGEIFGPLTGAEVLDAYTPLTIRDWVNSPQGSPYGIMRSSKQLHATTFLHHVNLKGLFFAGQNALSPGALGTLLGSFQTVRQMIGHERFSREVFEKLSRGR
ncbi:MAG: NAD(P)/FAD-dependent oxidoreductase [Deltaproteobacteria bacterium]|nr:NAD(P)/FAD-dependent oxidoreductase [Deltaproteobacteria bacterium]